MKIIPNISLWKGERYSFGFMINPPMLEISFFRWRLWIDWWTKQK